MDEPQKFYETFQKKRKFPAGNKAKKTSKLLEGKNQLLAADSSSEANKKRVRRRNCCYY